jgi:protein-disulfide isomerase
MPGGDRIARRDSSQPTTVDHVTSSTAVDLNRHVYGDPAATRIVVEYGDFECPYCRKAAPVLRTLIDSSAGQVRLVFRHFPLFTVHPFALTAALAAEASGPQFWAMHDLLFAHQDRLADDDLDRYGAELGLTDVTGSPAQQFKAAVKSDYRSGLELGVRGTPTLFIDGRLYSGHAELGAMRRALELDG